MGRQEIQSESHESSESSYFPPSSCHPHPWPASVQRRSILLLQQQWQLCQQEHEQTNLRRFDEKFFLGGDTPSLTGNQALDGGIVGLGLGALGAAVLGPTIQGALNGAQQSQGFNSCGRRKRQANFGGSTSPGGAGAGGQDLDGEERFFLPTGQGCTCNNGRRRRQAPGEDQPGTRFFGGLFGGTPHCGSCCYSSQPFNNNGFNSNFQNQGGFNNQGFNQNQ